MIQEVIRINERVEIEAEVRGERENYPSRIESLTEGGIVLAAPLRGGVMEPIRIGAEIKVVVPYQDSLFAFPTTVLSRWEGRIPYLVVGWPQELSGANRRAYFRLDVLLNMDYAILDPDRNEGELATPAQRGLIKNLSGCGLLAWVDDDPDLRLGSELTIDIHLPEVSGTVIARVVRKEHIPDDPKGRVAIGLNIESMAPNFRDQIIRYLFQEQRERRNKGIL